MAVTRSPAPAPASARAVKRLPGAACSGGGGSGGGSSGLVWPPHLADHDIILILHFALTVCVHVVRHQLPHWRPLVLLLRTRWSACQRDRLGRSAGRILEAGEGVNWAGAGRGSLLQLATCTCWSVQAALGEYRRAARLRLPSPSCASQATAGGHTCTPPLASSGGSVSSSTSQLANAGSGLSLQCLFGWQVSAGIGLWVVEAAAGGGGGVGQRLSPYEAAVPPSL